jgi:hypothetical protein
MNLRNPIQLCPAVGWVVCFFGEDDDEAEAIDQAEVLFWCVSEPAETGTRGNVNKVSGWIMSDEGLVDAEAQEGFLGYMKKGADPTEQPWYDEEMFSERDDEEEDS